jgi:hypothetical protein
MRPFIRWCLENRIVIQPELVTSQNQLADAISRPPLDHGDYTLDRALFEEVVRLNLGWVTPRIDMFASPGNCQLSRFVSRHPHWQAWGVDALQCPLEAVNACYANPPWSVIGAWLQRLRQNPHLKCLTLLPWWVSTSWWPLLVRLHVPHSPIIQVLPYNGLFQNCLGQSMPMPRWPLVCILLSGSSWKGRVSPITPTIILHHKNL